MEAAIILGLLAAVWLLVWLNNRLSDLRRQAKQYLKLSERVGDLEKREAGLSQKADQQRHHQVSLDSRENAFRTLVREQTTGFPLLAKAYSEFVRLKGTSLAKQLATKQHPAPTAAETVRRQAEQNARLEEQYRIAQQKVDYYEGTFPLLLGFADKDRDKVANLAAYEARLAQEREQLSGEAERQAQEADRQQSYAALLDETKEGMEQIARQKSQGFPWLARAYDDHFRLQDLRLADLLEHKDHPAPKASEAVRQVSKERREAEKAARISAYLLDYCRYLAPWLDEYIGLEAAELDEIISEIHSAWEKKEKDATDEVRRHYGPKYDDLSPSEKLQKRLDWHWERPNKSNWQLGRDYERYIGYLYEVQGWRVHYYGRKGFEDLGRDLICRRDTATEVVQCKYWARDKLIHEKHIFYLFGTTVEYYLETFGLNSDPQLSLFPDLITGRQVVPKLVATIGLSPKAEQVASILKVVVEQTPFERYPSVKCNVARATGERIFHLPFDQQYDTVAIEDERLECYVKTVAEAEALGFRHAYRWKGQENADL